VLLHQDLGDDLLRLYKFYQYFITNSNDNSFYEIAYYHQIEKLGKKNLGLINKMICRLHCKEYTEATIPIRWKHVIKIKPLGKLPLEASYQGRKIKPLKNQLNITHY